MGYGRVAGCPLKYFPFLWKYVIKKQFAAFGDDIVAKRVEAKGFLLWKAKAPLIEKGIILLLAILFGILYGQSRISGLKFLRNGRWPKTGGAQNLFSVGGGMPARPDESYAR